MYSRFIGTKCFLLAVFLGSLVAPSWGQVVDEDLKLLAEDGASGDYFGTSIAIDNGVIVIGARRDQDNGFRSGSIYLFDVSSGAQIAKLVP